MREKKTIRHYLWVRIFFIVLITVLIIMTLFIAAWQKNTINYLFQSEEKKIIQNQEYISDALERALSLKILSEGTEELSDEQIQSAVQSALYYNVGEIVLFRDSNIIGSNNWGKRSQDTELLEENLASDECYIRYYKTEDGGYVRAVSSVNLLDKEYKMITTTDISQIYDYQNKLLGQITLIGIAGGAVMALILLLVFHIAFRPLKQINENVKRIAGGSYEYRLNVKRRDELGELAANINDMAQAVNDNIISLKEAAAKQEQFIQNIAHELKTPLTSIICYAQLLQTQGNVTEEKRIQFAAVIADEGQWLKHMSDRMQDYICIGVINEYNRQEVNIKQLMQEVCGKVQSVYQKYNIGLQLQSEDFSVRVEQDLFERMLYNYLDNARKASVENGEVRLSAYQTEDGYTIEIADHGIGMAQEEIGKIEDPFYMIDKARGRKTEGVGLGMAIAGKIAAAHHGEVRIESIPKEGTIIRIHFLEDLDYTK